MSNAVVGVSPATQLAVSGNVQDFNPVPVPAASLTKVGTGTLVFAGPHISYRGTPRFGHARWDIGRFAPTII